MFWIEIQMFIAVTKNLVKNRVNEHSFFLKKKKLLKY